MLVVLFAFEPTVWMANTRTHTYYEQNSLPFPLTYLYYWNNAETAGFVGLAVRLVVWTSLLILTSGRVGISQVVQKSLRNNKG